MTMAAEIKNRVGPPAAAQPGAAGIKNQNLEFMVELTELHTYNLAKAAWLADCCKPISLLLSSGVKIDSKPVEANKAGGCC